MIHSTDDYDPISPSIIGDDDDNETCRCTSEPDEVDTV